MDKINVILSDNDGNKKGEYAEKELAHTGRGQRHLAITVLLYNSQGEVLLQRRKHKRFDNIWDITGATDLRHLPQGDETFEDATFRCLEEEYGIKEKIALKNAGEFNYYARYGTQCENEHCAIMIGKYDGEVTINPSDGYEYVWVKKGKFLEDIENDPDKYSPWSRESVKILKSQNFFS